MSVVRHITDQQQTEAQVGVIRVVSSEEQGKKKLSFWCEDLLFLVASTKEMARKTPKRCFDELMTRHWAPTS